MRRPPPIVSSLPLLNRPDPDRVALLADAFDLLSPTRRLRPVHLRHAVADPAPRAGGVSYTAEASQPVWLNLPPARVWCYRPASAPVPRRANVAQRLVRNIKKHTNRVRDEILETRDRLETEIRLAKDRVRIDIAGRGTRVRDEVRDNPALEMIRKLGERRDR